MYLEICHPHGFICVIVIDIMWRVHYTIPVTCGPSPNMLHALHAVDPQHAGGTLSWLSIGRLSGRFLFALHFWVYLYGSLTLLGGVPDVSFAWPNR